MCNHLLKKLAPSREVEIPSEEMNRLINYPWPGNVRELRNVIERALIVQKGRTLRPSQLLAEPSGRPPVAEGDNDSSPLTLRQVEELHIKRVLAMNSNNLSKTARDLGISLSTLKRKLRSYGIR